MSFLKDWFGGGGSDIANKANRQYQQYMQQGLNALGGAYQQSRGDISGYYDKAIGFQEPYMQSGAAANQAYMASLGLAPGSTVNTFRQSPGYQFALKQGLGAVNAQAAAAGQTGSGAQQKELMKYATGMADQEYGNYQNRLSDLAQMGQRSAMLGTQTAMGAGSSLADLSRWYGQEQLGAYTGAGTSAANSLMAGYASDQAQRAAWLNAAGQAAGAAAGGYMYRKPGG